MTHARLAWKSQRPDLYPQTPNPALYSLYHHVLRCFDKQITLGFEGLCLNHMFWHISNNVSNGCEHDLTQKSELFWFMHQTGTTTDERRTAYAREIISVNYSETAVIWIRDASPWQLKKQAILALQPFNPNGQLGITQGWANRKLRARLTNGAVEPRTNNYSEPVPFWKILHGVRII